MKKLLKNTVRLWCACAVFTAAAFASVTVTSPASGSTSGSPVHFLASASSSNPITGMRIYLDNIDVYHSTTGRIDVSLAVASGKHTAVIKAWDTAGASSQQSVSFSVGGRTASPTPTPSPTPAPPASPSPTPSSGLPAPPAMAIVKADIDQMTTWESCTVCAGNNAAGPVATYAMTENLLSPSLDAKAARFDISGSTPYSDAIWWKQLGANAAITHFKYDVYFYLKSPQYAQALEFDVNQSDKAHKFIFGTECNIHDGAGGHWDVWGNAAGKWLSTGIPCSMPAALTWHHLTWEFQRDSANVTYIGFSLDGVTHYVNKTYPAKASTASEINVAFQMDGNSHMDSYSAWLDKVSLTYW